MAKRQNAKTARGPAGGSVDLKEWDLRLYVAGPTPRAIAALENLKKLCEDHLAGKYHIEVKG